MAPQEKKTLEIYGLLQQAEFYQAKVVAQALQQKHSDEFHVPQCNGMMENQWIEYLKNATMNKGGDIWKYEDTTLIMVDGVIIGSTQLFLQWCKTEYDYEDFRPIPLFHALAKEEYKEHLKSTNHDFVYFDISIGKKNVGRILIELFSDQLPKTCENFKQLSLGTQVENKSHTPPLKLTYKNSIFHRVVKNGWIQGGDLVEGKGNNGWSIYGEIFNDENYSVLHTKRGMVGMANKGRHSNSSQFYFTLQPCPWMDCQYVAFGEIIEGLEILCKIESVETYNERPLAECLITDCGLVDVEKMFT